MQRLNKLSYEIPNVSKPETPVIYELYNAQNEFIKKCTHVKSHAQRAKLSWHETLNETCNEECHIAHHEFQNKQARFIGSPNYLVLPITVKKVIPKPSSPYVPA
jgi:hypothetical protein